MEYELIILLLRRVPMKKNKKNDKKSEIKSLNDFGNLDFDKLVIGKFYSGKTNKPNVTHAKGEKKSNKKGGE